MKKEINFTIRFSKEEIQRIEKIAKKLNMPKSTLIRNLTILLLEDLQLFILLDFPYVEKLFLLRKKANLPTPRTDACDRPQAEGK